MLAFAFICILCSVVSASASSSSDADSSVCETSSLLQKNARSSSRKPSSPLCHESEVVQRIRRQLADADRTPCQALQVSGATVLCNASGYDLGAFNEKCYSLVPAYVVIPLTAAQLQYVVLVTRAYGLNMSVRGGGHSYVCDGFKAGSVHVDMRKMTDFEWSERGGYGFAKMGPGHTLTSMAANIPAGFEYAIGTCPTVGVTGYLIHGKSSPRTRWMGNTTLYSMDVVTAEGNLFTIGHDSEHADLWTAMRQAGSSFGLVTSLTIRLAAATEKAAFFIPTNLEYHQLAKVIFNPAFIALTNSLGTWVGLFRFDAVLGSGWHLKVAIVNMMQPSKSCNSSVQSVASSFHQHLEKQLQTKAPSAAQVLNVLCILAEAGIGVSMKHIEKFAQSPSSEEQLWGERGLGKHLIHKRYTYQQCNAKTNTCPDASSSGGFYAPERIRHAAHVLHGFYTSHNRTQACWFDLGPVKGPGERVFMDLSCYSPKAVAELADFLKKHQPLKGFQKYYNLPVRGTGQYEYWPTYDELSTIKAKWDPCNFFNVPYGIHPPGVQWPSYDPFSMIA
eukprot:TRINITY_DN25969_c0_g1_i1.p1 TRINITY_DN25969_c0_g1~~TRINITY_DN25969_c0_g1_i1.p1  ORF type:complete len:560 (-),score=41.91 TRINITY_DN25969_c0_g1_i1:215-1894(-)